MASEESMSVELIDDAIASKLRRHMAAVPGRPKQIFKLEVSALGGIIAPEQPPAPPPMLQPAKPPEPKESAPGLTKASEQSQIALLAYMDELQQAKTLPAGSKEQEEAEQRADVLWEMIHGDRDGQDDQNKPPDEAQLKGAMSTIPANIKSLWVMPPSNSTFMAKTPGDHHADVGPVRFWFMDTSVGRPGQSSGEWTRYEGSRGGKGWKNTRTGRIVYTESPTAPGSVRREREQSASRAHSISARVLSHYNAPDEEEAPSEQELQELATHLPQLNVDQLRNTRNRLAASFGGGKRKEAMVAALRKHVADLVATRNQSGGRLFPDYPGRDAEDAQNAEKRAQANARRRAAGTGTLGSSGSIGMVPISQINVDPERFQFKQNVNKEGVTDEFKGVKFNPELAGVISVWRDPQNGKDYVVNGHHRLEMARRSGQKDMAVRYLNASNAAEARAKGALLNIAEGKGTPLDAAKFFRDMNVGPEHLAEQGISLKGAVARDAIHLRNLSDPLFHRVARGQMDSDRAVQIGKHLAGKDDLQNQLANYIERRENATGREWTPKMVSEAAQEMANSPTMQKDEGGLFGGTSESSLLEERAALKSHVRAALGQQKRDFEAVGSERRAANVAGAGNDGLIGESGGNGVSFGPEPTAADTAAVIERLGRHHPEFAQAAKDWNGQGAMSAGMLHVAKALADKLDAANPDKMGKEQAKAIMKTIPTPKSLPYGHDSYFKTAMADAVVPMSQVQNLRARPDGIENASRFMEGSRLGKLAKREPIKVVKEDDGTYTVADGNSTFANAKANNWPDIPVKFVDRAWMQAEQKKTIASEDEKVQTTLQGSSMFSPEELSLGSATNKQRTQAEIAAALQNGSKEAYDQVLDRGKGVQAALGASVFDPATFPKDWTDQQRQEAFMNAFKGTGPVVMLAPPKNIAPGKRAEQKVNADLGGDWGRLHDVVRGTVAVDSIAEIPKAIAALKKQMAAVGYRLAKAPKVKYTTPTLEGYRDINLNFQGPDGLITEVQVNAKPMMFAKEGPGHKLYEQERDILAKLKLEGRRATPEEAQKVADLVQQQRQVYTAAYLKALGLPDSDPEMVAHAMDLAQKRYSQRWDQEFAAAIGADKQPASGYNSNGGKNGGQQPSSGNQPVPGVLQPARRDAVGPEGATGPAAGPDGQRVADVRGSVVANELGSDRQGGVRPPEQGVSPAPMSVAEQEAAKAEARERAAERRAKAWVDGKKFTRNTIDKAIRDARQSIDFAYDTGQPDVIEKADAELKALLAKRDEIMQPDTTRARVIKNALDHVAGSSREMAERYVNIVWNNLHKQEQAAFPGGRQGYLQTVMDEWAKANPAVAVPKADDRPESEIPYSADELKSMADMIAEDAHKNDPGVLSPHAALLRHVADTLPLISKMDGPALSIRPASGGKEESVSPARALRRGIRAAISDPKWKEALDWHRNLVGTGADHTIVANRLKTGGTATQAEADAARRAYQGMSEAEKTAYAKSLGYQNLDKALPSVRDELVDRTLREGVFRGQQEAKGLKDVPDLHEGELFGEKGVGESAGLFDSTEPPVEPKQTPVEPKAGFQAPPGRDPVQTLIGRHVSANHPPNKRASSTDNIVERLAELNPTQLSSALRLAGISHPENGTKREKLAAARSYLMKETSPKAPAPASGASLTDRIQSHLGKYEGKIDDLTYERATEWEGQAEDLVEELARLPREALQQQLREVEVQFRPSDSKAELLRLARRRLMASPQAWKRNRV